MSKFYVGQKVVCINSKGDYPLGTDILIEDEIYTIAQITMNGLGCQLVGVNPGTKRNGYYQSRFAPVKSSKESEEFADNVLEWVEQQVVKELEPSYL